MAINQPPLTPRTKSKLSPLIVMASVAVLLGLIAAGGIWQYLSQTQRQVKELSATRPVVIASKEIPAGTKLTEEFLVIKQLPAQTIPKDYPNSIEAVKGRIVRTILKPDEIITETRLVGEGASGGLPIIIPSGKRAITIKVDEVIGVGGFISPGDHVDILSVVSAKEDQTFSKTILQDILVLAAGGSILDPAVVSAPEAKIVTQVTVALDLKQAEELALASEFGELKLILRPHGDSKIIASTGVDLEDLYGELVQKKDIPENMLPITQVDTKGDMPKNIIEIILGNQRSYYYY